MAEFITEHPNLKPVVRTALVPALVISTLDFNTTPNEKIVIADWVVLVPTVLAVLVTKWRDRGPDYTRQFNFSYSCFVGGDNS